MEDRFFESDSLRPLRLCGSIFFDCHPRIIGGIEAYNLA